MKSEGEIVIGIDASRNRSGGARAHLRGILRGFDEDLGIKTVHVWAFQSLLDELPDRPYIVKHHHPFLESSLAHQLFWQAFILRRSAEYVGCNILFATDASTLCGFNPLVVLSQDLLSYESGVMRCYPWGWDRIRLEAIKVIQNLAFRRSKGVLFLTKYASELVQSACGNLGRVALAPHGIDDNFRDIAQHDWENSSNNFDRVIRCVYVSNADVYKHHWHVVEAFRLLRDRGFAVELKLIGGGCGVAQVKLQDAITRCDPEGRFVSQSGFVNHSDLPALLAQADLFVFASSCENLPVTLLEGMATGLPIACSDRGPMPEVLEDGGVYFDPEDSVSIAAAVHRLIESQDLRSQVSSKAKRLASNYSWKNCSQNTFKFIMDTCNLSGNNSALNRVCTQCIMDTSDPNIQFDDRGRCDYCNNFDSTIAPNWQIDTQGRSQLMHLAETIKADGKGREFDCILGLSGGLDSSYAAYVAVELMGLRPLLFHVDAGWNTGQAVENIEKLVDGLGLDLYTDVVNWKAVKRMQVAFLRSGIPDQDLVQDAAFFSGLYKFANKYKIKHIITGSNFSTECCREPEEWGGYLGIDKTLFSDIWKRCGDGSPNSDFPLVDILLYKLWYQKVMGMRVHHPLNLVPYIKKNAEDELERLFGWQRFQHKHHESRFTRFYEDYWLPRRFGYEKRRAHFSSLIMTGQMTRDEALERISRPEMDEHFLKQEFEYVAHKLGLSVQELQELFEIPKSTYRNYKNKRDLIAFGASVLRKMGLEKRYFR